jgi:formylglycine-generating enzyme required for sulfatase activity
MRNFPDPSCPIGGVEWYEAAAHCNWLSQRESIPQDQWCYETNAQGQVTKLKTNYLSLTGYRLPTEPEWEYACRAGAVTSRYYGESADLLEKYGWYIQNGGDRSWPVGNDLGLFDMHGNVWNWCQESYQDYPRAKGEEITGDNEDILSIEPTTLRGLRGGSFLAPAKNVRCAQRLGYPPQIRYHVVGFRPARTIAR